MGVGKGIWEPFLSLGRANTGELKSNMSLIWVGILFVVQKTLTSHIVLGSFGSISVSSNASCMAPNWLFPGRTCLRAGIQGVSNCKPLHIEMVTPCQLPPRVCLLSNLCLAHALQAHLGVCHVSVSFTPGPLAGLPHRETV